MITSLSWVPRGVARQRPIRYELTPEEYQRVRSLAQEEEKQNRDEEEEDKQRMLRADVAIEEENLKSSVDVTELPAELDMEHYDDDEYDNIEDGEEGDGNLYGFQQQGDNVILDEFDSDDEDAEDNEVRPTDALLAVAMTEDEYSHLEIQLLSEDGNLYVHHDIALPDFPLCLAWTDCPPFLAPDQSQVSVGNFMAVGTFDPVIEIWNLDVLDPLEPTATLGAKTTKKKKKSSSSYTAETHSDAVMGLNWNRQFRQAMASCSADKSVKIWDITTQACSHTFTHHSDKVQSVLWSEETPTLLATGSFDKSIALADCRSASVMNVVSDLSSDVESMAWNPFNGHHLYVSLESGEVACLDIRMNDKSGKKSKGLQGMFQAHDETTTSISFSRQVQGLCVTSSTDKTVKIWDTEPVSKGKEPVLVAYKSMNVGQLFACQFFSDEPFMLGAGGDAGMLAIWDCDEQEAIRNYFTDRIQLKPSDYAGVRQQEDDVEMATEDDSFLGDLSSASKKQNEEESRKEDLLAQELNNSVATSSASKSDTKKKKKKNKVKKTN